MIRAVLYDLDGVLVNATEWHYESLNLALKEIAGFQIDREEHISTFNGIPTNTKLDILHKQGRISKEQFQEIWELKQEKTFEVINKNAFVDNVKIRLHEGMSNLRKVCVTNSIRKSAELMLEKTGQMKYMEFIISNEDVWRPKPFPEGYIKAMIKLSLHPDECMIVEDSPKGLEAAKWSGANVCEVKGYHDVTLENILRKINFFNRRE
ncbi:putative pyrophosphatase PpaX protein [Marine Group I thaumarchaeote SCGC AAA799-E16]|uniref:Putative pyrophosphatase PpaX protein n=2 Tax=Marine Group I TaxID=905826 RepID=A0A087S247_9ARCH|nr:putative pyrophosphatase PpaX protein [Marine Group I thaumarchaeote SCGC AAA799-E16]KFM19801.1 putative pyrophosphatase PpaX protein [Marine Group I thaumarchaeote SCGC RSA3]